MTGFFVDPESLRANSNLLVEVAGELYCGRLDREVGTLARRPYAPGEVATLVARLARFADDQYRDLVVLLMALATKLDETQRGYVGVDQVTQDQLSRILTQGSYVAPQDK